MNAIDTTRALEDALRARYADAEWERYGRAPGDVLLFDVDVGSGRRADAVLVRCWSSRGYEIHGFEIKASRSDFLVELRKPEKAEPLAKIAHRLFLVVPPGIVKTGEVPGGWGLLVLGKDGKLRRSHPAPKRKPEPLGWQRSALLVRTAFVAGRGEIERRRRTQDEELRKLRREIRDELEGKVLDHRTEYELEGLRRLRGHVDEFEKATGLNLSAGAYRSDVGRVAEAMHRAASVIRFGSGRSGPFDGLRKRLRAIESQLASVDERVGELFGSEDELPLDFRSFRAGVVALARRLVRNGLPEGEADRFSAETVGGFIREREAPGEENDA